MSEVPGTSRQKQEFEHVLDVAADGVASFEEREHTALQAVQQFLHGNPAMVPLIVLILSAVAFSCVWSFGPTNSL